MMSKNNLEMLEEKGHQYIIAAKLRALPHDLKKQVLSEENYKPVALGKEIGWVGEFSYNGRKLISSYKKNRALKDSSKRQQILNKINNRLRNMQDTKQFISNQGVKKYTRMSDSVTLLDEEKIANDAQWDGLHGVLVHSNLKCDSLKIGYNNQLILNTNLKQETATWEIIPNCR